MKNLEVVRQEAVSRLFDMATMAAVWPVWEQKIKAILGDRPSTDGLLDLGGRLAEVFATTGGSGREQASLSGGGAAWEGLVCWYLNLCLVDTTCVVFKQANMVPEPVKKALTVLYGTVPTNTESDLVAVTFPVNGVREVAPRYSNLLAGQMSFEVEQSLDEVEVCVIQCKTNWNDNAQIPMLWDMIYSSARAGMGSSKQLSVGIDGYSVNQLKSFSYAFVTVPSNQRAKYTSKSTAVLRVKPLSGGNYWGKESQNDVALRISAMLDRNFSSAMGSRPGPWRTEMQKSLAAIGSTHPYFHLSIAAAVVTQ